MSPSLTKVIYKPDSQSTEEFIIIVNPQAHKKWKDGDTTIPLVDVVDSFTIFHSIQGNQGLLHTASQQQLDTVFDTLKDVDVVEFILKNGKELHGDAIGSSGSLNISRGSAAVDTHHKGLTGI